MRSLNQIYRGRSTPPESSFTLQAGKLRLIFCNAGIRAVMAGDKEIVRRVYGAVRDDIWNTIGFTVSNLHIDSRESSFHVEFDCVHKKGTVDFAWHGTISGTPESLVRFSMNGRALSSFQSNRIGICVLHPLPECLGKPCTIITSMGETIRTRFPSFISPDQPFKNMRTIIQKIGGIGSRITFTGNTFEMEDQRNWTDASFKTYCPPRSRPYPFIVKKGDLFSQTVEIAVQGTASSSRDYGKAMSPDITPDPHFKPVTIPDIGCALGPGRQATAGLRQARLLGLSHLRVDVTVSRSGVAAALLRSKSISGVFTVPLEMALHFSRAPLDRQMPFVFELLAGLKAPVKRFLIFRQGEKVTAQATIQSVMPGLRRAKPGADIVTGTNYYFVEINKKPPKTRGIDGICYSANPQVHTFDDLSLLENLEGQFYTVQTARRLAHGAAVYVTPITLRPRRNPDLPKKFHGPDPRQKALFGAVWTLGSIIRCATAGASGATYFELSGPCGVMEENSLRVFPLFHVIADVNEFAGGTMCPLSFGMRSGTTGCVLEKSGRKRWLIANMSLEPETIIISGLSPDTYLRCFDETTFAEACNRPAAFRRRKGRLMRPAAGRLKLRALPYGFLRLDE